MIRPMIQAVFARDLPASRAVPPSGATARLTVFGAAVMAYLAVFALALSFTAGRLADQWAADLAQTTTLRLAATVGQADEQIATALRLLQQTPGVAGARALTPDEQAALLIPWFGPDPVLDGLPVPQLIEVTAGSPAYDAEGLRQRIAGELPGAILDEHDRWRAPLIQAASALRLLALVSAGLMLAATAAMITLAANASLATNDQAISVLRLVGARDVYIAQGFVRRFTRRGFVGSAAGACLGGITIALLPDPVPNGLLTGFGFEGVGWLALLSVPLLISVIAFLATLSATDRKLRKEI